jgi:DNA-binding transcriptional ArsR family regulator
MTRKARHVKPQGLVRGLQRGLQVLRVLNEKNYASVLEINRATGLPRTTIYRLLDTLIDAGYVKFGNREEGYCLTVQVRTLSEGYLLAGDMTDKSNGDVGTHGQNGWNAGTDRIGDNQTNPVNNTADRLAEKLAHYGIGQHNCRQG